MESILNQFSLKGKVALVTGSRRGIGQSLSVGLAQAGAKVVSLDRTHPENTRRLVESIGAQHSWKQVDLKSATPEMFKEIIDTVWAENGGVDICVNNAGICLRHEALSFPVSDWTETLRVNLTAAWLLSQEVARRMVDRGSGKIINIASLLSFQGGKTVPAYAATKHGILGMTRALANELSGKGVNVNAIAPGYIHTDLTAELEADSQRCQEITSRIPAGHWGSPEDLQGTCIFLASEASQYVHGACIPVDGGWLSR